jgi:hypothetical protein
MYINETIQKHGKYKYTYYQNTHTIVKTSTHYKKHPHIHTLAYAKSLIPIFAQIQQSMKVGITTLKLTSLNKVWLFWGDFDEIYKNSNFCG